MQQSLAFLRVGLDAPEDFCVLFADRSRFASLTAWLQDGYRGQVQAEIDRGKLALIGGSPTRDGLVANIGATLDAAIKTRGYKRIRFLGFIGWGLPDWPDEDSLLEFESAVNEVVTAYPAVIICTYGVPKLPGTSLIYGGLRTHPLVALEGGAFEPNPFYVPPDGYQAQLPKKK
ncbi:MAG: MEDS domain-containing protein [Candidatus Dormibacteraeota bacterium]|nr:MEDS domain-containing protein [Candidatus Dormibacteraeota bacterium]